MPTPSLTSLPPAPGTTLTFDRIKTVSRNAGSTVRLDAPDIAAEHAVAEFRDGAWWIRPAGGTVEVNGVPVTEPTRLRDADQIRFGATLYYEFATGERRTRRMTSAADMVARPRKRASGRLPGPRRDVSFAAIASIVVAIGLIASAGYVVWYGMVRAPASVAVLNDRQAAELDTLLTISYDHIERGGTLLELGLGDGALDEFAQAVTTLDRSDLRNNPLVKPRIQAIEASVAAIYREQSLAVPDNYARATSALTPEQVKTASLTADEFAAKFQLMTATFDAKFGHEIVVSGRDHAEHVFLYGKGGAIDLSIKDLGRDEVDWIIAQCHAFHIRVKDFSQDSILRRQVARAVKAGLLFEAGTGLHLHIDRFANKHDRWTALRERSDDQELDARHASDRKLVAVFELAMFAAIKQVLVHVGAVERRIDQEVLPILPHDRAVVPRDESLRVAEDQVVLFLGTVRFGRTDPEYRLVDRIQLAATDPVDDLEHRLLA